ncbi:MAG: prepilin-type N-terminal cleavage/methylation domain-containing protein [Gammaproteobacteria bacterium]|nr:prepilin-type N-terminal cleavage/methylation domain-containing protein [Gammaproteobacteria bacterium]
MHPRSSCYRCRNGQAAFTLVEIAIALVIIGLLVGAILKGAALLNSSKVRRLVDLSAGTQAAYLGFVDRYRRVPGDMNATAASAALGVPINGGGNDNGRIDNPAGFLVWVEVNALWEHLSKSGLIKGQYEGTPLAEPTTSNSLAPVNVFNRVVILGRTAEFEGASQAQLHMVLGRGMPVAIARELDAKVDDGVPDRGAVRATFDDAGISTFVGTNRWGGREAACIDATPAWDAVADAQDCNLVVLF